jgi:hypothetical protein
VPRARIGRIINLVQKNVTAGRVPAWEGERVATDQPMSDVLFSH